jgi:hypothetical protein
LNSLAWRLRRTAARRYPFLPYRDRPRFFRWSPDEIFEGIVDTWAGVRVRVAGDPRYYSFFFRGDYESYHAERSPDHRPSMTCSLWTPISDGVQRFLHGGSRLVVSFTPSNQCRLSTTSPPNYLANNCTSRVRSNRVALGAARGWTTIRTYAGLRVDTLQSRTRTRGRGAANGCEVPTLDDYCEENRVPRRRFHESRRRGSLAAPRQCWPHRLRPARSIEPEHIFNELRSAGYAHFFRFSIRAGVRPVQAKL